jgi:hypothetical protein
MVDTFKNLTSQQCRECKKVGLARLECKQCNVIYCVRCRQLRVKSGQCSVGHKLSSVTPKQNLPFLCDICGEKEKMPKQYYVDKSCNIGVCTKCFEEN